MDYFFKVYKLFESTLIIYISDLKLINIFYKIIQTY